MIKKEAYNSTNIEEAFRYCTILARKHYENFPVGSWIVPKDKRKYIHAVYAFARTADDFADEGHYADEERLNLLDLWEEQLILASDTSDPFFTLLHETIEKFSIPVELFKDLLKAFRMDIKIKRYATKKDLLEYCRYSANPVGRIVLYIFDYKDPVLHSLSDHICTALQLTNFWQDIRIDLLKGRIYIPLEDMEYSGYGEEDLKKHVVNDAFTRLLSEEIAFTRDLFMKGHPLCDKVKGRLSFELKAIWAGGMKILEKIEKNGYDVFHKRPVITLRDKVEILARLILS